MSKPTPRPTSTALSAEYAPLIRGKTVLVTGASPGTLGAAFAVAVSRSAPKLIVLAGRDVAKQQKTADEIAASSPGVQTRVLALELSSLKAVRAAAAEVNGWEDVPQIDVLVANAAIMAVPYGLSPDGFEMQFATNHLGHFLFVNLVADKLLKAGEPRVVVVSSDGHRLDAVRHHDVNYGDGKTYDKWAAYGQSKSAQCLMAVSLAEKLGKRGLQAYSLHPGNIMTHLGDHLSFESGGDIVSLNARDQMQGNTEGWREFNFVSADHGASTFVFASFDEKLKEHNGAYLIDCRLADPFVDTVRPWITSSVEAQRTWQLSEKLVGQQFTY